MERVSLGNALSEPGLRQKYVDGLVGALDHDFEYVDSISYVSNEEIAERGIEIFRDGKRKFYELKSVCVPNSVKAELGVNSNIYLTQRLFDEARKVNMEGVTLEEIETLLSISLRDHEDTHARHFREGIPGVVDKIVFTHQQELFSSVSELEAHKKTIVALGELSVHSDFLRRNQDSQLRDYGQYYERLRNVFRFNQNIGKITKALDQYRSFDYKQVRGSSRTFHGIQILI
tara:strand:+ start:640 stop:1332 length:693 start_codon:yes stop_codon:yes gene_type:complete